jgi:hypothetical protein
MVLASRLGREERPHPQEIRFGRVIDLSNEFDATVIQKRPDVLFEIPTFRAG